MRLAHHLPARSRSFTRCRLLVANDISMRVPIIDKMAYGSRIFEKYVFDILGHVLMNKINVKIPINSPISLYTTFESQREPELYIPI